MLPLVLGVKLCCQDAEIIQPCHFMLKDLMVIYVSCCRKSLLRGSDTEEMDFVAFSKAVNAIARIMPTCCVVSYCAYMHTIIFGSMFLMLSSSSSRVVTAMETVLFQAIQHVMHFSDFTETTCTCTLVILS